MSKHLTTKEVAATVTTAIADVERAEKEAKRTVVAIKTKRLRRQIKDADLDIEEVVKRHEKLSEKRNALQQRLDRAKQGDVSALDEPSENHRIDEEVEGMLYRWPTTFDTDILKRRFRPW